MSSTKLEVIGAGLGRTGTESLKKALEQLGFSKCYHMFELMKHPENLPEWEKLGRGETPNYDLLFGGYSSCTDFPAAMYYQNLMQKYPGAKVVLTVRDPDSWFDSASKTIFKQPPSIFLGLMRIVGVFSKKARSMMAVWSFARSLVHDRFFDGSIRDRERTKSIFVAWNQEVHRVVPPDRLLVFDVSEGWTPLCRFLDVPIPDVPFPRSNERGSFRKEMVKRSTRSGRV